MVHMVLYIVMNVKKKKKKERMTLDTNGAMVALPYDGDEGLQIIFKDGILVTDDNLEDIRGRA